MTPGSQDFLMPKGSTFKRRLTWKLNGSAVNLTGYSARMQARESVAASGTVLSLTSPSGGIVLGGTAGTIDITVSASTTAAISQDMLFYDLELVSGDGEVYRLIEGVITLTPEVTR